MPKSKATLIHSGNARSLSTTAPNSPSDPKTAPTSPSVLTFTDEDRKEWEEALRARNPGKTFSQEYLDHQWELVKSF